MNRILRERVSPRYRHEYWRCWADTVAKQIQCPAYIACRDKDLPDKAERYSCIHCENGTSDICHAA